MTFFQKIRSLWAGEAELEDESTPIEELDGLIAKGDFLDEQLLKAGEQYDISSDDKYLEECQELTVQIAENTQDIVDLQSQILSKATAIVALLPDSAKEEVKEIIGKWELTGQINGEDFDDQLRAIVKAVDLVDIQEDVDIEEDDHIEKAGNSLAGHYSNVVIKNKEGKILFLKRADDKAVAPGKYCLPGGHIDGDETIVQAGIRELKEEANIECDDLYPAGKAKCADGKWAFYLYPGCVIESGQLALLDGESSGACWMSQDEWMEADLFFDLKEHLEELEGITLAKVRTISKGETDDDDFEKGQFYGSKTKGEGSKGGKVIGHTRGGRPVYARLAGHHYPHFTKRDHEDAAGFHRGIAKKSPGEGHDYGKTGSTSMFWHNKKAEEHEHESSKMQKAEDDELEKGGHLGQQGEVRKWGNREFKKEGKKWTEIKGTKRHKPLPTAEVVAHAENTSTPRLKQVAGDPAHPHNDSSKRELERRKSEKDAQKAKVVAHATPTLTAATESERKKKPKPVKYEPNTDLDPHHRKVEKKFGKHLNKNFDFARGQYAAKFGNILNADNARELSEDYEGNRAELSAAVHEPASSFVKKLYSDMLKEPVPKNKVNMVLFSAGGTGAGKTTGMMEHGSTKTKVRKAHIIYDTNMNTLSGAKEKIEKALSFGKRVHIIYTFRDPVDAFENGAVPRAQRIGRTVPIGSHVATHIGSLKTVQELKNQYKDNSKVKIDVIDNSRGRGNSVVVPIGFLQDKQYIAEELQKKINEITEKLHGEGKITDQHKKGFQAAGN